jgi:ribonuclease HI
MSLFAMPPSGFGCGALLFQEETPVAFLSYKMNPAETRDHAGEQELLAVVKALEHWRHYFKGAVSVSVVTDHVLIDTRAVDISVY